MKNLQTKFTITDKTASDPNLAKRLTEDDRKTLGAWALQGMKDDLNSRRSWEQRMEAAMDLALQLQKAKDFPWPGCSNVAFPLVTIAAMQFHSRAYPTLISGTNVVKYRVPEGTPDPNQELYKRAGRVGNLMSRQVLEDDAAWEEQHDKMLIALPILGSMFIKTYFKGSENHNCSEMVTPFDLIMNYYSKSVESSPRKTHIIPLYRNDIYERVHSGTFLNCLNSGWYRSMPTTEQTVPTRRADIRRGENPPQPDESTPFMFGEQHCWIDMDQDGYAEPYILTFERGSGELVRMVARWERPEDVHKLASGRIIHITATEHFTKYSFIPSPDGGVYDLGFGILLGPLNESVNTAINQLIDAGTMATTAGGFLGRGAKIRGGNYTFSPFQWNRVDGGGDDLRKSMVPLPVREPSTVLFQLLSLLIEYTNRISGSVDVAVGITPGQNTPAETSRNALEQATKIYAAIFKRVWRSMKHEFAKLYQLNAVHLPMESRRDFLGDPNQIAPVADPNVVSDAALQQRAMMVKGESMHTPGYDLEQVEHDLLNAFRVDNVERIYPGPKKVPALPNPKMQAEQMKAQVKMADIKRREQEFVIQMMETHQLNNAQIIKLMAEAQKLAAEAKGVARGHEIAVIEAAIGAFKAQNDALNKRIELMLKSMEKDQNEPGGQPSGGSSEKPGGGGMANSPNKPALSLALPASTQMGTGTKG